MVQAHVSNGKMTVNGDRKMELVWGFFFDLTNVYSNSYMHPRSHSEFNPSDVSHNFRLMGAVFDGKLNHNFHKKR